MNLNNCNICPIFGRGKYHYDYLVVGAGLFGAVFTHRAIEQGKRVLVVEKRNTIGGNLYCYKMDGIVVHKYGPHIFHTSNKAVWDYVNSIVKFNGYVNEPLANNGGKIYHLPFNMNTFHDIWGVNTPYEAKNIIDAQVEKEKQLLKDNGKEFPTNLEEKALVTVGRDIYELLIKEYTEKQWGRKCTELPPFIIGRIPLRFEFNNNYFNDTYQGIPENGYNDMIKKMFKGATIITECDFIERRDQLMKLAPKIVYTGPIDEFYDYKFGELAYRTIEFSLEIVDTPNLQGCPIMNYTDNTPYTRVVEYKHFEKDCAQKEESVIVREYPIEWRKGMNAFYPVNDEYNNSIFEKYNELARKEPNVIFGGRLAEYKYYDMDEIVENAMRINI